MRGTPELDFDQALVVESLAYSMLLASDGFRAWRATTPVRTRTETAAPRVQLDQQGPALVIRLNRPDTRNAFDAAMRDALAEALAFAIEHPDRPPVADRQTAQPLYAGQALPHFNEVDECAGIDALITNRVWTALGLEPSTTLHDVRWGEHYQGGGVIIPGKEPQGGLYMLVADATPIDRSRTRIDIYAPTHGANTVIKAITGWATGEHVGCPDMTKS
jgi:hypothetical protein